MSKNIWVRYDRGKSVSLIWKHTKKFLCGIREEEVKALRQELGYWLIFNKDRWKRK